MRDERRKFRQGLCDGMAVALHRRTQLPMGLWRGTFAGGGYEDCHAACVLSFDPPAWVDVDGLHEGVPPGAWFSRRPAAVELVAATEEEVMDAFCSFADTREASIAEAERFLASDPMLLQLIEQIAGGRSEPLGCPGPGLR